MNHWAEEASDLSRAPRLKLGCDADKTFQLRKVFMFFLNFCFCFFVVQLCPKGDSFMF